MNLDQPSPAPNSNPVLWELVIADMRERDRIGRNRYGTPLQPHNGRDALKDLMDELLDAVVYIRQFQEEMKCLGADLHMLHARLAASPFLDADATAEIVSLLASILRRNPALGAGLCSHHTQE